MKTGQAKTVLSRRGLHWSIKYKSTSRFASGTVISQSSNAGAEVRPGASIAFVIAKAPPPPPTTAPPPPTTAAPRNCDPVYPDVCLHRGIGDYDCASGSGNGPNYVEGPIRVLPPDPFGLDGNDNDGIGCESG
jgi:beta-lactam-binding protein with PASTA domain